jgi:tRNA U34 5-methylaminomethyl-2-thiouridine-forming methyltransferase MnmC
MWHPVRTADGSWTLRHAALGATCHSLAGAWSQAVQRYAEPCRLRQLGRERGRVRLLDLGTGLGLNIAAAHRAVEAVGAVLHVVTIERDPSVCGAAFGLRDWPDDSRRHVEWAHSRLRATLERRKTTEGIELIVGSFADVLPALAPQEFDAVFFDPFAPALDRAAWSAATLAAVARFMAPHAILSTYSAALDVRVALARAGLNVGGEPRAGSAAARAPHATQARAARGSAGGDGAALTLGRDPPQVGNCRPAMPRAPRRSLQCRLSPAEIRSPGTRWNAARSSPSASSVLGPSGPTAAAKRVTDASHAWCD